MRRWLAIVAAVVVAVPGRADEPVEKTTGLYERALLAAAEAQAKAYGHLRGRDYYDLTVVRDSLTESLPSKVGPFRVSLVGSLGLRERFSKQGSVPVLELSAAQLRGEALVVRVTNYQFTLRRRLLRHPVEEHGLEGGAEVEFQYDCSQQRFVVSKVRLWGI